ncbi:unnamed protein product, partial [Enterobius vermicularis]|uniref:DUF384 domain-containing protein n=1 Tax=Enterobius vermicularis TaxID=51028 RepID=A0A0N4VNI5_ENTVE
MITEGETNHEKLLDKNDEFISALVAPLADVDDQLDDDEIQKLPYQLQYYDGNRCQDHLIVKKLIEALYQLCATKHGRTVLRAKGIYAILRELDKATNTGISSTTSAIKSSANDATGVAVSNAKEAKSCYMIVDSAQTSTLHSLIGILIRYETEMDVDPNL